MSAPAPATPPPPQPPPPSPPATGPVPPPAQQQPPAQANGGATGLAWFGSITGLLGFLFMLAFSYGAAKLSYDKFQSVGWAVVNFFFATFYYPYYAIFLSGPSNSSTFGGRRRR